MDQPHHKDSEDWEANTSTRTATIEILDAPHQEAVRLAISNVLTTEIAERTYAQIVDGLPLIDVVSDVYGGDPLCDDHPIFAHTELSAGVLETTRRFRDGFDPGVLRFDSMLLDAFQGASPGSRAFKTRLIEILALSLHQVAVILYNNNPDLSSSTSSSLKDIHTWEPPKNASRWEVWWQFNPHGPLPTLFQHSWYINVENYPEGAADMAGYWAESRILGGVVLFDRAAQACGESDAVYLHPDRDEVTYRICLLTDAQKKDMMDFFQAKHASDKVVCPLPILLDKTNTQRVDPEEPIRLTGVYRDAWERVTPPPEWMGDGRSHLIPAVASYQIASATVYSFKDVPPSFSLQWTPCFDDFTCANLIVRLDYDDISAGETTVAFIQHASNLTYAQDILINPGGPGVSGVATVQEKAQILRSYLGQKHNTLGFDPRGVNNSGLRLDCLPDAPAVAQYYDRQLVRAVDPESDASISEAYTLPDGGQLCSNAHRDDNAGYANSVAVAGGMSHFAKLRAPNTPELIHNIYQHNFRYP